MAKLDILDPVTQDFIGELVRHTVRIPLIPSQWRAYPAAKVYTWSSVPYDKARAVDVPGDRNGVYAFIIRPVLAGHDLGYLMYVGKAERQPLRTRFKQYFREQRDAKGRVKVRELLDRWGDHLEFRFTDLPANEVATVENELLRAFIPYCNEEFEATIRPAVRAFRSR